MTHTPECVSAKKALDSARATYLRAGKDDARTWEAYTRAQDTNARAVADCPAHREGGA